MNKFRSIAIAILLLLVVSSQTYAQTTFGKTDIGATFANFPAPNTKSVSRFTLTEAGTVTSLTAYFKGTNSLHEAGGAIGVIYAATSSGEPSDLIAQTTELFVPDDVDGWLTFSFDAPVLLPAGDYYLGVIAPTRKIGAMDAVGTNRWNNDTYSDGPTATFSGASSSGYQKSIYATYIVEVHVAPGGDVQAALNSAGPGRVVVIAAGNYPGNFVIRQNGTVVRGAGAVLQTLNSFSALEIAPGTVGVQVEGVAFQGSPTTNAIVMVGRGDSQQTTVEQMPRDVVLEGITITGVSGVKNGLELHAANVTLRNSRIEAIRRVGQETHGIAGWNGSGPYLIEGNYIEAASINILIGGAMPAIPNMQAADVIVRNNTIVKDLAIRGQGFAIKNLFELKAARRVSVTNNVFRYNWVDAQDGCAIVIKVANPVEGPGGFIEAVTEDFEFSNNLVTDVAGGVCIQGHDYNSLAQQTRRLTFRNNYFHMDRALYGGTGRWLSIGNEPRDVTVEYNAVRQNGDALVMGDRGQKWDGVNNVRMAAGPVEGFIFRYNAVPHKTYGFFTRDNSGVNRVNGERWAEFFPGGTLDLNFFSTNRTTQHYPQTNTFRAVDFFPFDAEGYATDPAYAAFGRQR